MRIVVIGGSGHIGSFLVPRLVRAGHEVVSGHEVVASDRRKKVTFAARSASRRMR